MLGARLRHLVVTLIQSESAKRGKLIAETGIKSE